jgi:RNA recognition motif-containing protein
VLDGESPGCPRRPGPFRSSATENSPRLSIKIITDRESGRPRGFAFVELTEPQMAETAIAELHGAKFGGRTIVVNHAHQPNKGARPRV